MLTREEVIEALKGIVINPENVRVSTKDYSDNPLAPEKIAYKITGKSLGSKFRYMYYPNTVGFQGF